MAAFSYQTYLPFALDFSYPPAAPPLELPAPSTQHQAGDVASIPSFFPCYSEPFEATNIDVFPAENWTLDSANVSIGAITTTVSTPADGRINLESSKTVPSVDGKITSSSSASSAQRSDGASKTQGSPRKKRKDRQTSSSGSAEPMHAERTRSRKLHKCGSAAKEEENKAQQEPPTGYVHVRARRGEATDSHSLAERVRREKIRERMKRLQDLVPGCDKVVGKAFLLDEIINYIQSLQYQMQFLSMRLIASKDPTSHDVVLDGDYYEILPENPEDISPGTSNVQQARRMQPTAFTDATSYSPVQDSFSSIFSSWEGFQLLGDEPLVTEGPCEL